MDLYEKRLANYPWHKQRNRWTAGQWDLWADLIQGLVMLCLKQQLSMAMYNHLLMICSHILSELFTLAAKLSGYPAFYHC